MKKLTVLLCSLTLVFGVVAIADALPIKFDVAGAPDSSIIIKNISTFPDGWTDLKGTLVIGLDDVKFDLDVGKTKKIDFFTLTASGTGLGSADIAATLAFSTPYISTTGSGDVSWGTLFGKISGGILTWNNLPNIKNIDGTTISIDFEDGIALVCGDTATVHAYVTNLGGGTVSVPEPGTMLMLGFVLLGLVGVSRKRFNNRN